MSQYLIADKLNVAQAHTIDLCPDTQAPLCSDRRLELDTTRLRGLGLDLGLGGGVRVGN